jgi:alkylation response protein AidB-like acyl-CoA dehydrogenase
MNEIEEFRQQARRWLEANCPDEMRDGVADSQLACWGGRKWKFRSSAERKWLHLMAAKRWTTPSWPNDCGGAGLSSVQAITLKEELARIGARPALYNFGITMLGPALLKYGTREQKMEHLPSIARGEIRWCQGYSEPGAGSDLASLQLRCESQSDRWLLNGRKIWTSHAHQADCIFCLVRTDPEAEKHRGISFILVDLSSPGISIRPIKLISGDSPFCEVLFDNVEVPKVTPNGAASMVGDLNSGWEIAMHVLVHERTMLGEGPSLIPRGECRRLGEIARMYLGVDLQGRVAVPFLRYRIAEAEIDDWAFRLTAQRARDELEAGHPIGAHSSVLKYCAADLRKRGYDLMMAIRGSEALEWLDTPLEPDPTPTRGWLTSRAASILGGTSEIQLNIIAKRLLGLSET